MIDFIIGFMFGTVWSAVIGLYHFLNYKNRKSRELEKAYEEIGRLKNLYLHSYGRREE